jgi:hypothetical protein
MSFEDLRLCVWKVDLKSRCRFCRMIVINSSFFELWRSRGITLNAFPLISIGLEAVCGWSDRREPVAAARPHAVGQGGHGRHRLPIIRNLNHKKSKSQKSK